MDVAGRAPRLRALLDDERVDGLLVTALTNIRYLTGFTGSAGLVVVTSDELVLVTDRRYTEQAADPPAGTPRRPPTSCRAPVPSPASRSPRPSNGRSSWPRSTEPDGSASRPTT